ncbi:MAG TPA: pyridoxamine 5'-phosphate oxidase family protein [Iamia sp.]|nr:pyridoxamine 5'-phosphate oxidase family protein [Iamia sp.]
MTTNDPATTVDPRFSMEGAPPVPWPDARQALEEAGTYWLSTVRSDGRPHVTTLIGLWNGDALYFSSGPAEQKCKNLETNPHCVLTTGTNRLDEGLDVVVEGEAVRVTDETRLRVLAEAWDTKYGRDWQLTGSEADPDLVFEVLPVTAFGFRKGFGEGGQGSQTRWHWDRS